MRLGKLPEAWIVWVPRVKWLENLVHHPRVMGL